MPAYQISAEAAPEGVLLRLAFGDLAEGGEVARDALKALEALALPGGRLARLHGPASLAVALILGHKLAHLYGAVAVFDPKLQRYIVAILDHPSGALRLSFAAGEHAEIIRITNQSRLHPLQASIQIAEIKIRQNGRDRGTLRQPEPAGREMGDPNPDQTDGPRASRHGPGR